MIDTAQFEYSLAAAVCLDPKRVLQLRQIVRNEDFSIPACAAVFDAAERDVSHGKPFDANIAADGLRDMVEDPRKFLAECIDVTPTLANSDEYARLLHKRAAERRLRENVLAALEEENPACAVTEICKAYLLDSTGGRLKSVSASAHRDLAEPFGKRESAYRHGIPTAGQHRQGLRGRTTRHRRCSSGCRQIRVLA